MSCGSVCEVECDLCRLEAGGTWGCVCSVCRSYQIRSSPLPLLVLGFPTFVQPRHFYRPHMTSNLHDKALCSIQKLLDSILTTTRSICVRFCYLLNLLRAKRRNPPESFHDHHIRLCCWSYGRTTFLGFRTAVAYLSPCSQRLVSAAARFSFFPPASHHGFQRG